MLPNKRSDPTGQNTREAQAAAALRARVARCVAVYRDVLDRIEFTAIQTNAARAWQPIICATNTEQETELYLAAVEALRGELTVNATTYEFRTLPGVLSAWLAAAEQQVDAIMLEGGMTNVWFAAQFVEPAYRSGATRNRAALAAQSVVYKAARPDVRSVLLSEPYQRRLSLLYAREFEEMKGLGAIIKKDMAQILTSGLATGQGPIDIARQMTAQLGIEKRRAERIARTEINNAHTNARMDQAEDARINLGLDSREMHISALSPTTRKTHRDRHGTLHTVQAQRDWWARDGNRINCKCSTVTVLVNKAGQPLSPGIVAAARAQRK